MIRTLRLRSVNGYLTIGIVSLLLAVRLPGMRATDCNNNNKDDGQEISEGLVHDCNKNNIPDSCDLDAKLSNLIEEMGVALDPGNNRARIVQLVDADLDADLDLYILGNDELSNEGSIRVLFNGGGLSFDIEEISGKNTYAMAMESADFDGDLDPDIAAVFSGRESIEVVLNRMQDGFQKPLRFDTTVGRFTINLEEISAGDLEGDSDSDLVATSQEIDAGIVIYRNSGLPAFTGDPIVYATGANPRNPILADFDGDEFLDIMVTNAGTVPGDYSLFRSDGRGGFDAEWRFRLQPFSGQVVAADFDGDSRVDIVSPFSIYLNAGDATFEEGAEWGLFTNGRAIEATDIDNDGDVDVIGSNYVAKSLEIGSNFGDGAIVGGKVIRLSAGVHRTAAGDLTNDQLPDVVGWTPLCGNIPILVQQGPRQSRSADVNNNLIPDECEVDCNTNEIPDSHEINSDSRNDCNRNGILDECDISSTVRFGDPVVFLEGNRSSGLQLAEDLNGDQTADLLLESEGEISMLFSDGIGSLVQSRPIIMDTDVSTVLAADFDGDSYRDMCCSGWPDGIYVLLNAKDGNFQLPEKYAMLFPNLQATADVDADGDIDILVSQLTNEVATVYLIQNKGDGLLEFEQALFRGQGVKPGDFDSDGNVDLVYETYTPKRSFGIARNNGNMQFSVLREFEGAFLGAFDVNGDGFVDLTSWHTCWGSSILINDGHADFSVIQGFDEIGPNSLIRAVGDIDGDSDLDIVARIDYSLVVAFLNSGQGAFKASQLIDKELFPLLIDVDLDARLDLASMGLDPAGLHVLRNLTVPGVSMDQNSDGAPDECDSQEGLQVFGDANQDARLDISDAIWLLGHLFMGTFPTLPCEGGTAASPGEGDLFLLDIGGDGRIDISDALTILTWLFRPENNRPINGLICTKISGCRNVCSGE